jgi:hypothetical protein
MKLFLLIITLLNLSNFRRVAPMQLVVNLGPKSFTESPSAINIRGDDELKRIGTTRINGQFNLILSAGKLIGNLSANIFEDHKDYTTFSLHKVYEIYSPPDGYEIQSFKVVYDVNTTTNFFFIQRHFGEQINVPLKGPLNAITWIGDANDEHDQNSGCKIFLHLKRLKIILKKSNLPPSINMTVKHRVK